MLAVDAFGVGAEQYLDAVAGPFGDLGCCDSGVEPGRDAGVSKIVGPLSEWGFELGLGERGPACPGPDSCEGAVSDVAAVFADEQPAVLGNAEALKVVAEVGDKFRVGRDGTALGAA